MLIGHRLQPFFSFTVVLNEYSCFDEVNMAGKKVTKYDLVESVYLQTKCDKKVVQSIVESLFEQIKESLKQSATIELRGFGTFELRLRKGKTSARNPKTGEHVSVEPHYVAAFRSGQELKNALWSLPEKKEKD